jgi:hypothetical protein
MLDNCRRSTMRRMEGMCPEPGRWHQYKGDRTSGKPGRNPTAWQGLRAAFDTENGFVEREEKSSNVPRAR